MKILSKQELEKLTTKRLLAYKNKLMQVPELPNWDEPHYQLNKTDHLWQDCYRELKEILAKREHIKE